jgi:L-asparagine oxygenase
MNLTTQEINTLLEYSKYITISPSKEPELYCTQLVLDLPPRIKQALLNFKVSRQPYLLIKGFPVSTVKTPLTNTECVGEKTILSKIQALFVNFISEMIGYEGESLGKLFQDIVPDQKMAALQSSVSCDQELEIHTEQAFSKLRPDVLCLGCLRGDINAFTYVLPINFVLENITTSEYNLLKQPLWMFGIDYSFKLNNNEFIDGDVRGPFPILGDDNTLLFDQNLISGITQEAELVVKKIIDIYYKHRVVYCLEAGDI